MYAKKVNDHNFFDPINSIEMSNLTRNISKKYSYYNNGLNGLSNVICF